MFSSGNLYIKLTSEIHFSIVILSCLFQFHLPNEQFPHAQHAIQLAIITYLFPWLISKCQFGKWLLSGVNWSKLTHEVWLHEFFNRPDTK